MRYTAEILSITNTGDEAVVKLTNVKRDKSAEWHCTTSDVALAIPLSQAKNFTVGRGVTIAVELERVR